VINVRVAASFVPIMAVFLLGGALAQPMGGARAQSPSIVEIPIRLPLARLFEMAEAQMPVQAGNWHDWQKNYGIKTKYRAWRGPLQFTMRGELLLVQAHVRYWIKAHKKVLGALNLQSSCGVDEPPRQAIIGVMIRLGWSPDWTLRPEFRVMSTRFLERCEMTIADIDVTPLIGKEFQRQLENKMRTALRTLRPRLSALRQQAERSWFLLQQPIEMGADHWLLLNPEGIALSPLTGHRGNLDAYLGVVMLPNVVSGSAPIAQSRPLPPLMPFYPRWAGLNLQMVVDLNYADINGAINELLSGQSISIGGHQTGIESLELGGQGREIHVNAKLTGDAAGYAIVKANIAFVTQEQAFKLHDLDYSYAPDDPWLEPQARLFHGYVRKALEAAANEQLQQRMAQWKERLLTVLDKILPEDVKLDMGSLQLSQVNLEMEESGIRLNGLATGHIAVEFR